MAGSVRKAMLYLGLADDNGENQTEYVEEYDEMEDDVPQDLPAEVTPLHRSVTARETSSAQGVGADLRRITTVHPRSYNDAMVIGEAFRGGTPVIMNVTDMDDADAKRLVDFSAGLAFALFGSIEKVTKGVFLLSPQHVEISGVGKAAKDPASTVFYNQS